MSNVTQLTALLDDLKSQGKINETMVLAKVMRAAFEVLSQDQIEDILADAEAWQIDEWDEQDRINTENRRKNQNVVSIQGEAA